MDQDTKRQFDEIHRRIDLVHAELQPLIRKVQELEKSMPHQSELIDLSDRVQFLEEALGQSLDGDLNGAIE